MSYDEKQMLIKLIDRLSTTQGATQYYEGKQVIDKDGIEMLKTAIRGM